MLDGTEDGTGVGTFVRVAHTRVAPDSRHPTLQREMVPKPIPMSRAIARNDSPEIQAAFAFTFTWAG